MRKINPLVVVGGVAGAMGLGTLAFFLTRSTNDEAPAAALPANVPPAAATAPSIVPQAGALPVTMQPVPKTQSPVSFKQPSATTPVFRPAPGVVYAGGSPDFDEATGTYRRYIQAPTGAPPAVPIPGAAATDPGQMRIMPYPNPVTQSIQKAILHPIQAMPYPQLQPDPALALLKPRPITAMSIAPRVGVHRNFLGGSGDFDERGVARI